MPEPSPKKVKAETPWSRLNKTLDEVMEREKVEMMYPVRGPLDESDDEESEDESEEDTESKLAKLSEDKCKKCRWILVDKAREEQIDKGFKIASAGQEGDGFMMFNTSTGNQVIMGSIKRIAQIKKLATDKEKFDAMLGLTIGIKRYDDWMPDNDCGYVDDLIVKLGKMWKSLLKKSDADLCIDPEFTRPGVEAFLKKFEKQIDYVQSEIGSIEEDFVWQ